MEIARGQLSEMVLLATENVVDEKLLICLQTSGHSTPLAWNDIIALRRDPEFPIDI